MKKKVDESAVKEAFDAGYKPQEIAELLDISRSTVYKMLSKIKQGNEDIQKGDEVSMKEKEDELLPFQQQLKSIVSSCVESDIQEEISTNKDNIQPVESKQRGYLHTHSMSCDRDEYRRGDIVYIRGCGEDVVPGVQDCDRYGVIFQNNEGNMNSGTVIVAVITSVIKKEYLPTHVVINSKFLSKQSMIMAEQVKTVSKNFIQRVGRLTNEEYYLFDRALACSFSLATKREIMERRGASITEMLDKMCESKFAVKLESDNFSFSIKNNKVAIGYGEEVISVDIDKCEALIDELGEILKLTRGN